MNIDQYRAMKAQEEATKAQPNVVEEPVVVEPIIETKPIEPEPEKPITVEIDGKQVDINELKNGYLRQSDYTKKLKHYQIRRKKQKKQ